MSLRILTAEEAASFINNGDTVGFGGFTPAGAPKVVSKAIAAKAQAEHDAGRPFKIAVVTGASTGASLDGALAKADAISWRTPYQSNPDLRNRINAGQTQFFDMHLSMLPQAVRYGFLGKINVAIVEACDVTPEGEIVLTTGVGAAPTFLAVADKVIVELNKRHPKALRGFHDIYQPQDPPNRREIPVYKVSDRIGSEVVKVDPSKILGIVETEADDETGGFSDASPTTMKIGENVAEFLAAELKAGRMPGSFLPIQSGVGDTANAVLEAMGKHPDIPAFTMYTEVIQDAVIKLMQQGRVSFASGCSLTVSSAVRDQIYSNLEFYRDKIVLRPQEISNNPEIVRRLGISTINTAIEVDIFGNVNSTHILGKQMMNGIGGSGDFTRNAFISIYICPSTTKGGKISTIVPAVTHTDHNEHSVQIVITENGIADLRGKSPSERARLIVENCAAPEYRESLRSYLSLVDSCHTPQTLSQAYAMHDQFAKTGSMQGVEWKCS